MTGPGVRASTVRRPDVPRDTLHRERLTAWLDRHGRHPLVLVVADAGSGKTTLLADWAARTERPVAWYRLEGADPDRLTFVRHLVAALPRPGACPRTRALLERPGPGDRDLVADMAADELARAAADEPGGIAVVLDDYHLVDGSAEVEPVVRALVARAGRGLTVVLASRTRPRLALGRLRAQGGVALLDGRDLAFDAREAERVFRDAWGRPLPPDVLAELLARTRGWAASLRLVEAALEAASEPDPRAIVAGISGAHGEIHDFLAEELLGSLRADLRAFVMAAALLEAVEPRRAAVVAGRTEAEVEGALAEAEAVGLLVRPGRGEPHRFHPLVREFLAARLAAEAGADGVRALHRRVAEAFEHADWRTAAHHHRLAGDEDGVARVMEAAVHDVLAAGDALAAGALVEGGPVAERVAGLVIRSRARLARGDADGAVELATLAVEAAERDEPDRLGLARLNAASIATAAGVGTATADLAARALATAGLSPSERRIGEGMQLLCSAVREGDLPRIAGRLLELVAAQARAGEARYAAVTRLNLASVLYWAGAVEESLLQAREALEVLDGPGHETEAAAASANAARALAWLGRLAEAEELLDGPARSRSERARYEALVEGADILAGLGSPARARALLETAGAPSGRTRGYEGSWLLASAEVAFRTGDLAAAAAALEGIRADGLAADVAALLRTEILAARLALARGDDPSGALASASTLADAQRSPVGRQAVALLAAMAAEEPRLGGAVARLGDRDRPVLSLLAEEVAARLHELPPAGRETVRREAAGRPVRWRDALLRVALAGGPGAAAALDLLTEIGGPEELAGLRARAADPAVRAAVPRLARRLAPPLVVRDLGPIDLEVEGRAGGRPLRRKVASLIAFLVTRPQLAATRDEVLEALWPDAEPEQGLNSLNQTIYHLRRLLEPDYREGLGAGYLQFDGEMLRFDPELVDSASRLCWRAIAAHRRGDRSAGRTVVELYGDRFALEFPYEDWAEDYRVRLHAAALSVAEEVASRWVAAGEAAAAAEACQRILAVAPDADGVELTLLRAYLADGRRAAAAEQYAHWASVQREQLGVEPPPLEAL